MAELEKAKAEFDTRLEDRTATEIVVCKASGTYKEIIKNSPYAGIVNAALGDLGLF
jgi:hypothetical protein